MNSTYAIDTEPLLLNVRTTDLHVTPAQFDNLCRTNPDLRLELTSNGKLIVMAPTFGESRERNGNLFGRVWSWNERTQLGKVFDSSTGYDFSAIGGGKLSPDVSWIESSRIENVSLKQFIPVVPDFLIELRSTTDRLSDLQAKMLEYQRLGVKLGLLINPQDKQVEIYRIGEELKVVEAPISIAGSIPWVIDCQDVMVGFILDLTRIL